ncbi:transmembrane protein 170A isoform X1 [Lagenorhynchus albirostris]|nr:transmembrane protein 170A isoform X1 [Lagenorhynchus albirostris]
MWRCRGGQSRARRTVAGETSPVGGVGHRRWISESRTQRQGREQLSPRPCHLRRPMIGGRSHHLAVPLGWRKRASAEGDAEATEVRRAEWAVSESEPRQHFRRSPPPLCEMWYGVFLWALVSSLFFHVPAGLLALFTLRHHKYGRFMSVSILLMGIVGPITAGILTSAAIAGVYRAAGKEMIPFEALTLGTGQTFCVVVVSFLRILATL